jgi:DNA-binding CsgD family transcriptional regulator
MEKPMYGQTCVKPLEVHLTARELQVIQLVAQGCTYALAADRLGVSLHTVTTHIKNAYRKLEVHSAAAAVMRAVQLRFIGEGGES